MKRYKSSQYEHFYFLPLNNIASVRKLERSITSFSVLFCYIFEKLSIIQFFGRTQNNNLETAQIYFYLLV